MKQKLMTKAIEKALSKSPLYSHDGDAMNAPVIVKYFLGSFTWYVIEGEKQKDGDWLFFGYVDTGDWNSGLGYFTLSELENVKIQMRVNGVALNGCYFKVERDMYFDSEPLKNFINNN